MAKRNAEDIPFSKTRIVDLSLSGLTPDKLRSRLLNAQQRADQLSKTLDDSRSEVKSLEARLRSSEARVQEQQEELEAYMNADTCESIELGRKYTETYQALEKMEIALRTEKSLNESLQNRNNEKTRENFTLKRSKEDSVSSTKGVQKGSPPDSTRSKDGEESTVGIVSVQFYVRIEAHHGGKNSVRTDKPQERSVYSRLETGAVRKLTLVFPRDIVTSSASSSSSNHVEVKEQGAPPPTPAPAIVPDVPTPPLTHDPLTPTSPAQTSAEPSWLQWALLYVAIEGIPSYDGFLKAWKKAEAVASPTVHGIVKRPVELENWVKRPSMASRFETERDPKFTTAFALTFPDIVQTWWFGRQPAWRGPDASNRLPAPHGPFPMLDRWGINRWVVIFVALKWWWQAISQLDEGDRTGAREQWKVVMEEMKATFEHIVARKKT
ncbi:hypothetical protein PM082_009581 [Marasmius tenuissimus]|nr:hypothetical protein PM082_009581 [Marasmius tenuissimus]